MNPRRLGMLALLCLACSAPAQFDPAAVEQEAQAFMVGYAENLRAHDAAAIADRYDRNGAYFLGHGRKELRAHDAILAQYRDAWTGPAAFEWEDLSYEVITGDAVVVAGRGLWTADASSAPITLSYTGLLLRQGGELRIRLEDESIDPAQLPATSGGASPENP